MIDTEGLLNVARYLVDDHVATPGNERLRRAVSTAYYAVFHKILRAAAIRFMGIDHEDSPGFSLIYRSFEHRQVRDVCIKLSASTWNESLKMQLHRSRISDHMRSFVTAFPIIQKSRHLADYDPLVVFERSDVLELIATAQYAMFAFDHTASDEQADILALMMVRPRT